MHSSKHFPAVTAAVAVMTAVTLALAGCSDAQGIESPLDAGLIGSADGGLTGVWVLNTELSDRPEHGRPGGRPGFGGERPGRPGIGSERPNVGDGTRPDKPMGPDGMRPPRGLPPTLDITQTDQSVSFTRPDGQSHTFYTDGSVQTHELPNGGQIQVQATWSDGALVIVRSSERGTHTETLTLSDDEQQLFVAVRVESDRLDGAREFRLVYDRS